ncbi:MAG: GGDEF domain-containing protein [Betaproteobacteria bacterium]|nr:GGDEF domain-containing protein [Betaproteobacteria bacterium]MCL2887154.1 GGDEF domain-containing protein [Betaproteobacteria bacterium]
MSAPSTPFEIARETLRQLALRRITPTPDNYLALYQEVSGQQVGGEPFPGKFLRILNSKLPQSTPDQLRLARQLEEAVKAESWDDYRTHLVAFISDLLKSQKLPWATLIGDLLRQWEARHSGLTAARKREALEHVLTASSANPETLYNRLSGLLSSWEQAGETEPHPPSADEPPLPDSAGGDDLLSELRQLFAFALETAIATQLQADPQLASDAQTLANDIRAAGNSVQLQEIPGRLKRFAFKLELLAEDQAELRNSLLGLLRLLVENIAELVIDDNWLHGQIEMVHELINQPLSQRAIDAAEQRLKEVLFKQSQLKTSLVDAKNAIKNMLTGFVDHLADFADATSDYHDKIEACAAKISAAEDIGALESVLSEVMRETRNIQFSALRSRDESRAAQRQVEESQERIRQLEHELEATSTLVRHDQLTGALNRRGLEEIFTKEIGRCQRHNTPLCLGLLDIDNFKKLNDSLGHEAGDHALIHLAAVCRETLRPQDTIARYGGEEFVVLLPETRLDEAMTAFKRLQRKLTKKFFLHNNDKILITFSAGVTQLIEGEDQNSAIKRADRAMYQAKQAGKNQVISA